MKFLMPIVLLLGSCQFLSNNPEVAQDLEKLEADVSKDIVINGCAKA